MNLFLSIGSLITVLKEDLALRRLGIPFGWLLHLHYQGRLADRRGQVPPLKSCSLQVNGSSLDLVLSAAYDGAFKGVFIDGEYQCHESVPGQPLRILDLGANIGMGTLHLHTQFPGAAFVCVEPDERNLPLLKTNLEANRVDARIVHAAAGAEDGTLKLRFGKDPTCSALETSPMHDLENCVSVKVLGMESILKEAGWDTVDLLKIDIEGVEDELLSSSNGWLDRVGAVILEIHPNTTPERILSYLKPFGFSLRKVGETREPVYLAIRQKSQQTGSNKF